MPLKILRLQRQGPGRDAQAHPDPSLAQFLPLAVAREERDTAYGKLAADLLEHLLSGAEERDGLSPD